MRKFVEVGVRGGSRTFKKFDEGFTEEGKAQIRYDLERGDMPFYGPSKAPQANILWSRGA